MSFKRVGKRPLINEYERWQWRRKEAFKQVMALERLMNRREVELRQTEANGGDTTDIWKEWCRVRTLFMDTRDAYQYQYE